VVDDVEWLNSFEPFGGYEFPFLSDSLLTKGYGLARCAKIIREALSHDDFCNALIDFCESEHGRLIEARRNHALLSYESISAEIMVRTAIEVATWSGPRKFARLIEKIVGDATLALCIFKETPKRTATEHRRHYSNIAKLARQLAEATGGEPLFDDPYSGDGLREILGRVCGVAEDTATEPPFSRPNAESADRTYVAKEVALTFFMHTGAYKHAAAATLVNAIFPDREPIDAVYMQSLARTIRNPHKDDLEGNGIRDRAIAGRAEYDRTGRLPSWGDRLRK
jgi:hypothetical protein